MRKGKGKMMNMQTETASSSFNFDDTQWPAIKQQEEKKG